MHAEGDGEKQRSHPHRTAATSSKVTNVQWYRRLKLLMYTQRSSTKYLPGQVSVKSVFSLPGRVSGDEISDPLRSSSCSSAAGAGGEITEIFRAGPDQTLITRGRRSV